MELVEFHIDAIERVYRYDHCVQKAPKQDFTADYKQAEKVSYGSRVYSFLRTHRHSLKIDLHTTYSK